MLTLRNNEEIKKRKTKYKDKTMKKILILIVAVLIITDVKTQPVIQNQIFTSTQVYSGSSWDGTIIKNCVFKNTISPGEGQPRDAILLMGASHVTIDSCIFYNIQGDAIRIRELQGGSDSITITNCVFDSIYGNGIHIFENNPNITIQNNKMNNIGLDTLGSANEAPHHGIYATSKNVLIENNVIHDIYNNNGNCVSIRSSGIIRKNILYNGAKFGISYYSDHPGFNDTLLIENNVIYNNQKKGIGFYSHGNPADHIGKAIVRFNTIIQQTGACIYTARNVETIDIEAYANIGVRLDNNPKITEFNSTTEAFTNLFSNTDIGFVDIANNDYHILATSSAIGFATSVSEFPTEDFENDQRTSSKLDAGADQLSLTSVFLEKKNPKSDLMVYPNPASVKMNIKINGHKNIRLISIYDINGKLVLQKDIASATNHIELDVQQLAKGIYSVKVNNLKSKKIIIK